MNVPLPARLAALIIFLLSTTAVCADAWPEENISLAATVDHQAVTINDQIRYTIAVEWIGAADRYGIAWPNEPDLTGLNVLGSRQATRSWAENGIARARQEFTWILKPTNVGTATIGQAWVNYRPTEDPGAQVRELTTRPVSVEVLRPADIGYRLRSIGFTALAALGLGILAGWYRARYRRRRNLGPSPPIHDDETVEALLHQVDAVRHSQSPAAFFTAASNALRALTARRIGCTTEHMSAAELRAALADSDLSELEKDAVTGLSAEIEKRRYAPGPFESEDLDQVVLMLRLLALSSSEEIDDN